MKAEKTNDEEMYFEDLPENVQEILLDLIVSSIRNTKAKEAGLVLNAESGTKSRKRKGLPRKKRAPSR